MGWKTPSWLEASAVVCLVFIINLVYEMKLFNYTIMDKDEV